MKLNGWFWALMVCLVSYGSVRADSYDSLWKKARDYERKDLPQSAYQVSLQILKKAEAEKIKGQAFSAWLYGCRLRQKWQPDSVYNDIRKLEARKNIPNQTDKAVIASLLGEVYVDFANSVAYRQTSRQASLDSLQEWSYDQCKEAAFKNYCLSMQNPGLLADVQARDYVPFITQGKCDGIFNGDLLHIITRRALSDLDDMGLSSQDQALYAGKWYASVLSVYRQKNMREAELWWMLDSVDRFCDEAIIVPLRYPGSYTDEMREREALTSSRYQAYFSLLKQFGDLSLASEIYWRLLNWNEISLKRRMDWYEEARGHYENSDCWKWFARWRDRETTPEVKWNIPQLMYPGRQWDCVVSSRNISTVRMVWFRLDEKGCQELNKLSRDKKIAYCRKNCKIVNTQDFRIANRSEYLYTEDTLKMDIPGVGVYGLWVTAEGKTDEGTFCKISVSGLKLLLASWPDHRVRCRVVDAMSGAPVRAAKVNLYRMEKGLEKSLVAGMTDASGSISLRAPDDENVQLTVGATCGDDVFLPHVNFRNIYSYNERQIENEEVRLYTDRAIYRPGQIVSVAGVFYRQKDGKAKVLSGRLVTLELCNSNNEKVTSKQVVTDDMGGFSASFALPVGGLSGYYTIRTSNSAVSFKVEEYKRPTFEIRLDEDRKQYHTGDTLTVSGVVTNYNGVSVRNARVTGTAGFRSWWMRLPQNQAKTSLDTISTDAEGRFSYRILIPKMEAKGRIYGLGYECKINATNGAGETHEATKMVLLANDLIQISLDMPTMWERHTDATFRVDLSGQIRQQTAARITVAFYRQQGQSSWQLVREDEAVEAGRAYHLKVKGQWEPGKYEARVQAVTGTDTVRTVQPFVCFDMEASRPVVDTVDWYYDTGDTLSVEKPVKVQIGSSADSVRLYYTLFAKEKVLKDTMICFSDSLLTFAYEPDSEYGDGLLACFVFVKNDKVYTRMKYLYNPRPDRQLKLSWSSFRDKLKPGDKETWTLQVLTPDGKPASARMMATLYDASLEQFATHDWWLEMPQFVTLPYVNMVNTASRIHYQVIRHPKSYADGNAGYRYCDFGDFDASLRFTFSSRIFYTIMDVMMSKPKVALANVGSGVVAADRMGVIAGLANMKQDVVEEETAGAGNAPEETVVPDHAVRTNLQETAFFYPELRTDKEGHVVMTFTVPESLTSWRFIGLAHTDDLMTGKIKADAVATKDIMAQLNLPRFTRVGDETTLTATLYNQTQKRVKGDVTMEIFDPATEKIIWKDKCKMTVEGVADTVVSFTWKPTDQHTLVACRVIWKAGRNSDGEQRYLPVLENKEWLTETRPFQTAESGETVVPLTSLFQNNHGQAGARRLTLEYTANPVWYAVQSLPVLLNPRTHNALDLAGAYYAATLTEQLMQRYPVLEQTLRQWQLSPEALQAASWPEKEELSGLLVEETPWAVEAEDEAQQLAGLQTLFDENQRKERLRRFGEQLGRLQYADGSFSWFQGMSGSYGMTLRVAGWLARSGVLSGKSADLYSSVDIPKMQRYLAGQVHQMIERDKERETKAFATQWLDYLYFLSLSDQSWMNRTDLSDARYALDALVRDRYKLDLNDKAKAAIILFRAGKRSEADEMMKSLHEYLVEDGYGCHLAYPSNRYDLMDRKIAVHVQIMEAVELLEPDDKALMNGLGRWLLSQKRVQDWPTNTATVSAVYALVKAQGDQLHEAVEDTLQLVFADGKVETVNAAQSKLAGLGYIRSQWSGSELENGVRELRIRQGQSDNAWGAVYAQFSMPLEQVASQASGMRITQEWPSGPMKVGDRVTVHYLITSDRDYDYVSMKIGRPACVEPVETGAGYTHNNGLYYYRDVRDASTNCFFERLPKGTHIIDIDYYVERPGTYESGTAVLSGVYAPEYTAHSESVEIKVKP